MFTTKECFKESFLEKLELMHGKTLSDAVMADIYKTLGYMVRENVSQDWIASNNLYKHEVPKQVYYLSMEFLPGCLLENNLINLGIRQMCAEALQELGINLDDIIAEETDPALGNGGLGRLAACFLDSFASMGIPGHGCGIRYKYGLFEQKIVNGYQVELPENWLKEGNVWEIRRPGLAVEIKFGGRVNVTSTDERMVFEHEGYESIIGVPYDIPVIGYRNQVINTLRLWSAEPMQDYFAFTSDPMGEKTFRDYKNSAEAISEYLYPDDSHYEGRILRLKQEYFLVSATLQSILNAYKKNHDSLVDFPEHVAVHLNDTHPVLAIPELMRLLLDQEGLGWDDAWHITTGVMSYTNHTTLWEALEKWPISMLKELVPRVYMIIEEINEVFCKSLWNKFPDEWGKISNMAITAYGQVRMAPLAIAGSHSVNGVSKIHTEILVTREMCDYYTAFPHKFNNKTNGISHRRWLLQSNPKLAELITATIGEGWISKPTKLVNILKYAKETAFQSEIAKIKKHNKINLAATIFSKCKIKVDPDSIFDVQAKRLHLYKRQLLNLLHIMDLYNRLQENPQLEIVPQTFIFSAKAAPGYLLSKMVIKLINTLAEKINHDPISKDKLKVIFLENYCVSLAEEITAAADVSEQISTATKEASGTGNMKFMMNGALTLGTLDGANIEIKDEVGEDNIFIFGLAPQEVMQLNEQGRYSAWELYLCDERIKRVLDQLVNGFFPTSENEFKIIYHSLLSFNDEFLVLKDFRSYADAHSRVEKTFQDSQKWLEMCICNIAHSGKFSSDGTVLEYARDIWGLRPLKAY